MDSRLVGFLLVVVAAAGFGSGAIFAKGVYEASDTRALTLMVWRFGLGTAATWLWLLAARSRRTALASTSRRSVRVGLALGVMYFGGSAAYFAGLETVPASLAALLVFIYPVLSAVLSLRWGRRLEGRRAWGALAIAIVGCVFAVGGVPAGEMPAPLPLVLAIVAPVTYSFWLLLQALLMGERTGDAPSGGDAPEPIVIAALVNTGAAAAYVVAVLVAAQPLVPPTSDPGVWAMIAGVGLLSSFVAIVGVTEGSRRIGAAQAALVSTVEPVFTIVLGAAILGEVLTPIQLLGGALIIAGVLVVQSRRGVGVTAPALVRIADE